MQKKEQKKRNPELVESDVPLSISILQHRNLMLQKSIDKLRSGEEIILDSLRQMWSKNPPMELFIPRKPPVDKRKLSREEIAVVHCTDVHYGKVTTSFNRDVCESRLLAFADKVDKIVNIRRSSAKISEGCLLLGGDMLEGENIFPHQAHEIDCSLLEQSCRGGPGAVARFVLSLLETFEKLTVVCVPGNHGRNGPFKNNSHPMTNWDRVLYDHLKAILLGHSVFERNELSKRLKIIHPDDWYYVHYVYDWGILLIHGDQMRGGFGGFPYYSIGKRLSAWAAGGIEEPFDYLFMGHWHSDYTGTLNKRRWFCTGSLESNNVWVQENLGAFNPPSQRLCFFDQKEGLISDNTIYLENRLPAMAGRSD